MSWFKDWFNTPYYHLLYKNRDFTEAEKFIDNIINYLDPSIKASFLDLACGKGRHSIYINKKGFNVTGVDLSEASIKTAQESTNSNLKFETHDMRELYKANQFDYVLNLFTSFGYFDDDQEDIRVLKAVHKGLKSNGILVFDYLNSEFVESTLKPAETINRGAINFEITKSIENNFVVKNIDFEADNKTHHFQERVKLLSLNKITSYLQAANFEVKATFGDYNLNDFNQKTSNRLIIIAQKIG